MLRGADIDAMAEQIEHFLTEQKVSRQDTLRLRLTMEELLLRVRELAGQCNLAILAIMERICRLIPLFVFITLLRQIWAGSLASLLQAWKPLAVFVAGGLLIVAVKLLLTGLKLKVSVKKLLDVLWPTFLVALSTASSAAVFGGTMDNCEKKLGISHKLVLLDRRILEA